MGSPNFKTTGNILLNFATLESDGDEDYQYDLSDTRVEVENDIDKLQSLDFHTVQVESGYHEGFQIMLLSEIPDDFVASCLVELEQYGECCKPDGYVFTMDSLTFCPPNAVNITKYNLEQAIRREYKYIHNELLRIAKAYGLGEVYGRTWTSSVGEISTKPV